MASATVESASVATAAAGSSHARHRRLEALPVIDLRLFTQSELYALSLSSSAPVPSSHDGFVVSFPKIDRSVFNESAGSHKQTYSRLRLAPRNSSPIARQIPSEPLAEENSRIISFIKVLFAPHAANEPSIADPALREPSTSVFHSVPMEITEAPVFNDGASPVFKKRKRGRPRKHDKPSMSSYGVKQIVAVNPIPNKEKQKEENVVEKRLNVVDLDRFEEELRKRTEGLRTEDELSGFLSRLSGEWGSRKKKRRIVEANSLGDVLPKGWKLLLSIKNDGNQIWLGCSRYISPDGQQFESCHDVSKHLLSLVHKDASHSALADDSNQLLSKISSGNSADPSLQVDQSHREIVSPRVIPSSSVSVDHQMPEPLSIIGSPENCQMKRSFNCHKCTMIFDEKDNLLLHLLSSHKKTRATARNGMPHPETVIMKDGKYECQLCQRLFEEKNRFSSHFGNHIKDYVRRVEGSAETTRGRKSVAKLQESIGSDIVSSSGPCNTKIESDHDIGFSRATMRLDALPETPDISNSDHSSLPSLAVVAIPDEHVCDDLEKQGMASDLPNDAVEVQGETNRVAFELGVSKGVEDVKPSDHNDGNPEASVLKSENKESMDFVDSKDEQTEQIGPKSEVAVPDEKQSGMNNENLVSSLFDSSMEEMELDDGDEVGNSVLISEIGDPCFGLEADVLNYNNKQQEGAEGVFVQNVDEKKPNTDPVIETQTSNLASSEKETVSQSCLPLPSDQQTILPNSARDGVTGNTVEEDRPYNFWDSGKTINFDGETATPSNDVVKSSEQESGMNHPDPQSLDQNACDIEETILPNNTRDGVTGSTVEEDRPYNFWDSGKTISFDGEIATPSNDVVKSSEQEGGMNHPDPQSLDQNARDIEETGVGNSISKEEYLWQREVLESTNLSAPLETSDLKQNDGASEVNKLWQPKVSKSSSLFASVNALNLDIHRKKNSSEEHGISITCPVIPSLNQHEQTVEVQNPWQQKVFNANSLSVPQKTSDLDSNIMNVSHDETRRSSPVGFPFGTPHQQSFLSVNNQSSVSAREEPKENMTFKGVNAGYEDYDNNVTSFSVVEKQKPDEATSTWNSTSSFTFDSHFPLQDGNASMGFVQERSGDASSHLFTRKTETVAPNQRGTVVYGGHVEEQRRNKEPESLFGLFSPNVDQQALNYNMDMFYPGTMQSDCRVGNVGVGPTRTNELMTGFFNQPKPREEVTQPLMWRTEENFLQNGLSYVSPSMQQQSNCFQSFNMVPNNKVQNEFYQTNQKLGNTSSVEGIRIGAGEFMEYNFLPAQSTNHSGSSKVTQLNQQMQTSYNPNWLEMGSGNSSSAANNSNRHQVTTTPCVWCGNQFTPESGFTAEAGSVGYMCFNCKSKLSGQINFF